MKRYTPYFESRKDTFKAWYNPNSEWSEIFPNDWVHDEIAEDKLNMGSHEAMLAGYIRVYVFKNAVNIESVTVPTDREFLSTQYFLKKYILVNKLSSTLWDIYHKNKFFKFPKQSFLFANSIEDSKHN